MTHELSGQVHIHLSGMPAERLRGNAVPLVEAVLRKLAPCPGK